MELDTTLIVGLVAAVATVLSASIPYYLGKRNDRNDKIRDKKIAVYDDLSVRISELLATRDVNSRKAFFTSYTRALAYADLKVIEGCERCLQALFEKDVIKSYNAQTDVFRAIRRDLNPNLPDSDDRFWDRMYTQS